ncbi:MAG TPA: Na+/H+ antiporter NhaC family protein [Gemmatimonadales bacterium]|nr:Na+/H+ antiporter NhaC family protein [Gemmatimonadales bacterium]
MTAARRFPHPFVLLLSCIAIAAMLTWVVPAGEFERRDDPATGRAVVVAGTYKAVPATPVGIVEALSAVPRGIIQAASVIALVFLSGAGFTVVERTGALRAAIDALVRRFQGRGLLVIPAVALVFAAAGALLQMSEELVAFAPLLLMLCAALGMPPLMAVAMSFGVATVAAAFSPVDPFMVTIAQKVAEVPVGSGWRFRTVFLAIGVGYWLWALRRLAMANGSALAAAHDRTGTAPSMSGRNVVVLLVVGLTFVFFLLGAQQWGWDFDKMAMLFLAMGLITGIVGGLGINGTADALVAGARDMTFSALLIGVARGIFVVLEQGHIVDTLVHAIATPLAHLPRTAAALGMFAAHGLIHVPVPSTSGHAVLTMPVLAPVSDLIGLSRQVAVLAYQFGAGMADVFIPTSGPLLAMLAATGVGYDEWLRWVWRPTLVLSGICMVAIAIAVAIGWS